MVSFDELWRDLERVPEGYIGEIVGGEIVVSPRPGAPHTMAASDLNTLLGSPFRFGKGGPGGWIILHEPRIRFGDEARAPDIAAWRVERFVAPSQGPFLVAPDWICEVLSPGTARFARTKKMPLYAKHRVEYLWLLDPVVQTLEVYRLQGDSWGLLGSHGGDDNVRAQPFDAIELDLTMLWGPPRTSNDDTDERDPPAGM